MSYNARIERDSINIETGDRLTTFVITYPRFVHSEFMTHRLFSRNAASSRAIPIQKMIDQVERDPAMPIFWGKNQKGMQAVEELTGYEKEAAMDRWIFARNHAVDIVKRLNQLDCHKQIVNRLLEPFSWITVVVSATNYTNFFNLRCHLLAQPEIKYIADMMCKLYYSVKPDQIQPGYWHLPFIQEDEWEKCRIGYEEYCLNNLCKISAARCARVSYLTHDGKRDIEKDLELYDRLVGQVPLHASALEHSAMALTKLAKEELRRDTGNFQGWLQLRKTIEKEMLWEFDYESYKNE